MSGYNGFFVRDQLGQTPGQTGSAWSASPDVIFAGAEPLSDPAQITTQAGYATDYGSTVFAGAPPTPNFVYLRALNTTPAASPASPVTGRAWFYWLEADLALWPQNWRGDLVTVAGQSVNFQDITATAPDQVCTPDLPYVWEPPAPAPGQHYCAIAWMENAPVSNPPRSPAAGLAPFATFNDLARFVLSSPNMAWRNTMDVSSLGLTWTQTTGITGPAEPTPFYVGIQCINMPTDGQVGYMIPGPTPQIAPLTAPLSPITNPNQALMSYVSGWPPNAASSITVEYRQGATVPPAGSSITVVLTIPQSTLSEGTRALAAAAPEHLAVRAGAALAGGGAMEEHSLVIGTMTYVF